MSKDFDCELVVSTDVLARAGLDFGLFAWREATVRGREQRIAVTVVDDARKLELREAADAIAPVRGANVNLGSGNLDRIWPL